MVVVLAMLLSSDSTMTSMVVVSPWDRAMSPLGFPLATGVPFTVTVALASAAVGVTFNLLVVAFTVAA